MLSRFQRALKSNKTSPSLLEIFKPVYILLLIVGLFPYNLKFKTKHCTIVYRSIYHNSLRAITVLLTMLVFASLYIRALAMQVNVKDKTMMTHINYILEVIFLLATCVTAYSSVYFYRYRIVKILNSLASAWFELPTPRTKIVKNLQFHVRLTLLSLVLVFVAEIILNFTREDGLWKMVNVTLSFIYPHMIQIIVLAFYSVLVLLLVTLLYNLDEALGASRNKRIGSYRSIETRFPNVLNLNTSTFESVFVRAFEIKREVNEAFQASILLTAVQCFHSIVSEAHIIYHGMIVSKTLTYHDLIHFSVWIGYQLMKIYTLAYSGNLLKLATNRIGQTLHNIPIENHDMRSLIETQHFTSLMNYQTTDLTVYGYFSLDASFMFKVIASATMYLIILVQFDK